MCQILSNTLEVGVVGQECQDPRVWAEHSFAYFTAVLEAVQRIRHEHSTCCKHGHASNPTRLLREGVHKQTNNAELTWGHQWRYTRLLR